MPVETLIKEECPHCEFINTLGDVQSNREYWLITEIFVHLHNGKDYCDWKSNKSPHLPNPDKGSIVEA